MARRGMARQGSWHGEAGRGKARRGKDHG